jgi:hypothetical protein
MTRPLSDDARQLLAMLQQHRRMTPAQLRDAFRARANSAGYGVSKWLSSRLQLLEGRGYVRAELDTAGRNVRAWLMEPQGWARSLADAGDGAASLASMAGDAGAVAQPRRVNLFDASVYTPPRHLVTRPGAMDYAAVPSLQMGERRPFRGHVE